VQDSPTGLGKGKPYSECTVYVTRALNDIPFNLFIQIPVYISTRKFFTPLHFYNAANRNKNNPESQHHKGTVSAFANSAICKSQHRVSIEIETSKRNLKLGSCRHLRPVHITGPTRKTSFSDNFYMSACREASTTRKH
jgi:hypothetical protein